ncbi:flagellar basal-body MS-ring/collar protein FliF [Telluria beijingensis]|uniref:flagellar basal-body MS-ring/collar protein FliF n=1 Tax=Telluria beijingensis TaxID=3068633 RepID=UPI00279633DF|nr:flagellar basal-body MS-ring/collar protein FliF [Massilia sp. REN29]
MAATAEDLLDTTQGQPPAAPQSFFQSTMGKRVAIGGGIALILALMIAVWMWSQAPEYRVLFSNYSDRDGGAITASLDQMGVQYKFSEGGNAILVPAEQIHDLRLKLAAQGLPKGGNVGFELMENQKLGVSQFLEQVNYQRSLEGELARSIQSLGSVSAARVHLALPKPSVFVRDQQKPTASVLLNLQPGRALDQGQVNAIVHLVASSVPELTFGNVTVVDQTGALLSEQAGKGAGNNKMLDATQLKYVDQVQENIIKQVEAMIKPLVGEGNVRAQATAEIDFAQVDTAAEMYKPNSPPEPQAIRSQQTSETQGAGAGASGIPGALSNQPPGVNTAPVDGEPPAEAPAATGPSTKNSTTNFEVDKTIRYEQRPMGGVKRLTVGVVVNYRRIVDPATGKVTVRPLAANEVAQINELVKQAMGFNPERGDTMNVTNAPFDGVDKPAEAVVEPDWWRDPANMPLFKDLARYAFVFAVIAFLYYRFLRPLLRPAIKKFDEATAMPEEPKEEEQSEEEAEEEKEPDEEELEEEEKIRRDMGYRANLKMAKELANQDPRIVANVIKAWLGSNE